MKLPVLSNHAEVEILWPSWVSVMLCAGVAANLGAVLHQRSMEQRPLALPVVYALLILAPFALDATSRLRGRGTALPLWAFPIPVIAGVALLLTDPVAIDFAPFLLVVLCLVVAGDTKRWVAVATGLASAGVMIGFEMLGMHDGSFIWVVGIAFGWCGGFMFHALMRRNIELEKAQAGLASKAANEERQRIAREVHDVIAHSLSVTMLHVTAARMATEKGRESEALDALREAERHGRSSLSDIRRTIGLLGTDEIAAAAPMPTAADLPTLVDDFRTAGLDVTLSMAGDVTSLPPAAGLDLYRIVQESLTNAAKHAPGAAAHVELNVDSDDVRLQVHNGRGNGHPVKGSGNGLGLRGMAERAAMLGGTLDTDDRNGWTVSVRAPRAPTNSGSASAAGA